MDGLLISRELNSILIKWSLVYLKTNMIGQLMQYNDYSPLVQSLIVRSRNSSASFHSAPGLFLLVDLSSAISSIYSKCLSHLHPHAMHNITPAARRDLLWWMTLLPQWSGVSLINSTRPKVTIHNDASGIKGIGGWWDKLHAYST